MAEGLRVQFACNVCEVFMHGVTTALCTRSSLSLHALLCDTALDCTEYLCVCHTCVFCRVILLAAFDFCLWPVSVQRSAALCFLMLVILARDRVCSLSFCNVCAGISRHSAGTSLALRVGLDSIRLQPGTSCVWVLMFVLNVFRFILVFFSIIWI